MSNDIPLHVVAVMAIIQKGDTFLLAKRNDTDDNSPGIWVFPGGKVELSLGHNLIEETLHRELLEEVGIEIEEDVYYLGSNGFVRSSGHHVVNLIFLCKWKAGLGVALEDHSDVKWVTFTEAESMGLSRYMQQYFEVVRKYLLK